MIAIATLSHIAYYMISKLDFNNNVKYSSDILFYVTYMQSNVKHHSTVKYICECTFEPHKASPGVAYSFLPGREAKQKQPKLV